MSLPFIYCRTCFLRPSCELSNNGSQKVSYCDGYEVDKACIKLLQGILEGRSYYTSFTHRL